MKQVIRANRIVTPEGVRPGCVTFENGRIVSIEEFTSTPVDPELIDAGDSFLLPGVIDTHVHVNEPGREHWEGFTTATRAAAAGGVTCLVDMPLNSIPSTTTVDALEQKRKAARGHSLIDYQFWGGLVEDNQEQLLPLAQAGARGFKCFLIHPGTDEFSMVGEPELRAAMPVIAGTGLPLLVHAEAPGPIAVAQAALRDAGANFLAYNTYLQSRPDEAETEAIRLMIRLCREYRCRVHIVHLSTAKALPDLKLARAEGLPITVETCPHYLYFAAESIPDSATQYKCAPPIRSAGSRQLLWDALRAGSIDLVATDHSPCPPEMKNFESGDFSVRVGRNRIAFTEPAGDVDCGKRARVPNRRHRSLDV